MELIIAVAMITIIFAAIVPQFEIMRGSWDSKQGAAETIQNGRVLMDHISRNLSKAKQITAVSTSSIDFNDYNGVTWRYNIGANNYVKFGPPGNLSDLAGPVSSLIFTCYDACDLNTPITDVNLIRTVKTDAVIVNPTSAANNKSFTSWSYLRVNGQVQGYWQDHDIGSVAAAGSASFASDDWTVVGSGVDIWDYTDGFHYVYQSLNGDGQIVARVNSITNTNAWAKAGVMIRETLTGGSTHAMMVVTPGSGNAFQRRTTTGGSSDHTAGSSVTAPYWVKVKRIGNTFSGYESPNGSAWTQVGSNVAITMATNVYIGLCVTSHNDGVLCTADFNNVSFLTYEDFNEDKAPSDSNTSVTIPTPAANVGDLLIAAVATDGSTTISPPSGWTAINQGSDPASQVTLGAWRRFAAASEPASHQFTWTGGGQKAYGWMMRFKGCDPVNPVNALSTYGESSQYPTSPTVTTTVGCCQILRLGAFNDDDITVNSPGLSGHSAITMDESGGSIIPVAILGSWLTGTTHAKESGANRALIFIGYAERTATTAFGLNSVTYGGQSMTEIKDINIGSTGSRVCVAAYYLGESGIAAATSTTFTPTWSASPTSSAYASVFLSGVNQTTPIGAAAANGTTTGATITTAALANGIGDLVIDAATCSNTGTYSANNGFAKALELTITNADGIAGYKSASGVNETPSVSHSTSNGRQSLIGFVVQGTGLGTVSGGAGYVRQSAAGDSGTSTFSLLSPKDSRMLTIAIAPDGTKGNTCCQNQIRP